jgi:Protein of unknown function (DUF4236)
MSWLIFRKTIRAGPIRLTASKSGLTASAGNKHYRQTTSTSGRRTTTFRLFGWMKRKSRG